MTQQTILTLEDKAAIDSLLESARGIEDEIKRAKLAGLAVEEHETKLKEKTAALRAIRQAYFPGE